MNNEQTKHYICITNEQKKNVDIRKQMKRKERTNKTVHIRKQMKMDEKEFFSSDINR